MVPLQEIDGRNVARAVVDAEVHVARTDLSPFVPVAQRRGDVLHEIPREVDLCAVPVVDIDSGETLAAVKHAAAHRVLRSAEPRLRDAQAHVPCGLEVLPGIQRIVLRRQASHIVERNVAVQRWRQEIPDARMIVS